MAIVACAYGLIAYGSVWYPINLLAAAALPSMAHADLAQLKAFDSMAFFVALISHGRNLNSRRAALCGIAADVFHHDARHSGAV